MNYLKFSTLIALNLVVSLSYSAEPNKTKDTYIFEWSDNLKEHADVFVKSFSQAYKDFSEEQLGLTRSKSQFLEDAFQGEIDDYEKDKDTIFLASIKDGNKIVGFAAFNETDNEGEVYIRQLAVDPKYWGKGIGKRLVFSIQEKVQVKKFVLVTRRINKIAHNFYKKLNFKESDYVHDGLDPKKYIGFELEV